MNDNPMYANQIEIALNNSEAAITFTWLIPQFEDGEIIAAAVGEQKTITMAKTTLEGLCKEIEKLLKEPSTGTVENE